MNINSNVLMKRMDDDWVWKNEEDAWKWILLPSINERVDQDGVWKNEELNWVYGRMKN